MGNLFNALNGLKTNIFGGGNTGETAPILRKSAIGINEESPTSKLDHDPFAYSSIQYPKPPHLTYLCEIYSYRSYRLVF